MAILANNSTGNFTTAGTWSLVDATSYLNTESVSDDLDTVYRASQSFVPGAITIDGIGVKVSRTAGSPTDTLTVRLYNVTDAIEVEAVTINVTDIPVQGLDAQDSSGWLFMKFGSSQLLIAGKSYTVDAKVSVDNTVYLWRTSPTYNWARYLRTTTTQAPVASDELIVTGEHVSAGSNSDFTVTMNNTTTDIWGAIEISHRGTLKYGITASTNYHLKVAGDVKVYSGGSLICGESGSEMPATSTAKLEFSCSSNVEFGLFAKINSTVTIYGEPKTSSALLAADYGGIGNTAASGDIITRVTGTSFLTIFSISDTINIDGISYTVQTVDSADQITLTTDPGTKTGVGWIKPNTVTGLTTDVSTGWLASDEIGIAPTLREYTEGEKKTLSVNAAGTALTLTTGLDWAKLGTAPQQSEVVNLTRNIKIFSASASNQSYVRLYDCVGDINNVEFYNLGSGTTNKRGVNIDTYTSYENTMNIDNCALHDFNSASSAGLYVTSDDNFTINDCVTYNIYGNHVYLDDNASVAGGTNWTLSNIIGISNVSAHIMSINSLGGTVQNLTAAGAEDDGIWLDDTLLTTGGTVDGITSHSNDDYGIRLSNITSNPRVTIDNLTAYNNDLTGIIIANCFNIDIDTIDMFGNLTYNFQWSGSSGGVTIKNITDNAGGVLKCPRGMYVGGDISDVYVDDSTFGATTTHATSDLYIPLNTKPGMVFRNCSLDSATPLEGSTNMTPDTKLGFSDWQQVSGDHRTYTRDGLMTRDTVVYKSSSPSTRIEPNTSAKLTSGLKKFAVLSGQTLTVELYIRKSVVGDGAEYNGAQPRVILLADPAMGIAADTVLATAAAANGVWELVSGTTPAIASNGVYKIYVDCDGTAGWVNLDDWGTT